MGNQNLLKNLKPLSAGRKFLEIYRSGFGSGNLLQIIEINGGKMMLTIQQMPTLKKFILLDIDVHVHGLV